MLTKGDWLRAGEKLAACVALTFGERVIESTGSPELLELSELVTDCVGEAVPVAVPSGEVVADPVGVARAELLTD